MVASCFAGARRLRAAAVQQQAQRRARQGPPCRAASGTAAAGGFFHVVREGETLTAIAAGVQISVDTLRECNQGALSLPGRKDVVSLSRRRVLKAADIIYPGQQLQLPMPAVEAEASVQLAVEAAPAAAEQQQLASNQAVPLLCMAGGAVALVALGTQRLLAERLFAAPAPSQQVAETPLEEEVKQQAAAEAAAEAPKAVSAAGSLPLTVGKALTIAGSAVSEAAQGATSAVATLVKPKEKLPAAGEPAGGGAPGGGASIPVNAVPGAAVVPPAVAKTPAEEEASTTVAVPPDPASPLQQVPGATVGFGEVSMPRPTATLDWADISPPSLEPVSDPAPPPAAPAEEQEQSEFEVEDTGGEAAGPRTMTVVSEVSAVEVAARTPEDEPAAVIATDPEEKAALISALYGCIRGLDTDATDQSDILGMLESLEQQYPIQFSATTPRDLTGSWKLVYTTNAHALLLFNTIRNLPMLELGDVVQMIDGGALTAENRINIRVPMLSTVSADASFEIRAPRTLKVRLVQNGEHTGIQTPQVVLNVEVPSSVVVLGQEMDLMPLRNVMQPIQHRLEQTRSLINRAVTGDDVNLPPWLLTTYLDSTLRVARDESQQVFVFLKDA